MSVFFVLFSIICHRADAQPLSLHPPLPAENAAHIKKISELRSDNRTLKAEKEALQFKLDDETFAGSSWKKEKDRFEMGLVDLRDGKQAAENSLEQARAEAIKHMSQLRDLRAEIDERDASVRVAGEKAALAVEKQRVSDHCLFASLSWIYT